MRPLLFLTFSQMRNSIRRSVTSARRLFAIIVMGAYAYFYLFRFIGGQTMRPNPAMPIALPSFPPVDVLAACAFGVFLLGTLAFWGMAGAQRGGFRPADVDMLFPTPIDSRVVLLFRMVRENFRFLMFPLIFLILGRGSVGAVMRNMPSSVSQGTLMKWVVFAYLTLQVTWIAASYAYSLWAFQDDRPDWVRRLAVGTWIVAALLVGGQLALLLRGDPTAASFIDAALHGPLRWAFPTATGAAVIATAPLTGGYAAAFASLAGFAGATVLLVWLSTRNVQWMYEHAALAASASGPSATALRSGDMMAAMTARARQGKLKVRRVKFLEKVRWRGPMAVVWREAVVNARTSLWTFVGFLVLAMIYSLFPILLSTHEKSSVRTMAAVLPMIMSAAVTWMAVWVISRTGFIDLLRRVDTDKALPFPLFRLLLAQSTVRNFVACAVGWVVVLTTLILRPEAFHPGLAVAVLLLPFAYVISGIVLVFLLLFPDIDDSSQKLIRDLLTMATMAVAFVPALVFGGLVLLLAREAYLLAALVASVVNCGIAALVLLLASELYASYNPSE